MHARLKRAPLIIIPLALVAAAVWFYINRGSAQAEQGPVTASGTIEATEVLVAPEISGQVVEVLVNDGQTVKAGQELVRFSDALIQAQLAQAQAAVAQAEANYQLVASGPPDEQQEVAIAAAKLEIISAQQAIDELYQKNELAAAQAEKTVADNQDRVRDAQRIYDSLRSPASQTDLDIAQSIVTLSSEALDRAEKRLKSFLHKPETNPQRAAAVLVVSLLEKQHDQAVKRLNYLEDGADQITLDQSKAGLELAKAALEDSQQELADLKGGPDPATLELAQARLAAAKAKLSAAQAGPAPEQLALAKSQVDVARAAAGVIEAQMNKLVLLAPMDGLVLSRSVEAGEVAVPGTPLLTLAKPTDMTITVYVPENRYGLIELGQKAQVSVDSFPGQIFDASVVHIADQAEFTPRNVQTEEGRRTTVYAIKLLLENPDGRLKPGMPADVEFEGL